jgi:hypothetical protein
LQAAVIGTRASGQAKQAFEALAHLLRSVEDFLAEFQQEN